MLLSQPDRFLLQADINFDLAIGILIDEQFRVVRLSPLQGIKSTPHVPICFTYLTNVSSAS
jgi:hypothetical protein